MNPNRMPDDNETDRLLASRFNETTPEFEARWIALKRELRNGGQAKRTWFVWPGAWISVAAAGVVAIGILVAVQQYRPKDAPRFSPQFAELFEMNEILDSALPLIDPENRDAFLNLPSKPPSQTRGSS